MADNRYIDIMIESLKKKEKILDDIIIKNEAQASCVNKTEYSQVEWDRFDVLIEEKETLIKMLNELDDGFEALYERVRDELNINRDQYKDQIRTMQELIRRITDKGVNIQTTEERNRRMIEKVMTDARKGIRKSRKSIRVVSDYYKSMSSVNLSEDQSSVDKKK